VTTIATANDGIDDLLLELDRHDARLDESGERTRRRLARARDEVTALAFGLLARRLAVPGELAARVADGGLGPNQAAAELLAALGLPGLARD
jgi:LAO/AO transport system kinase